MNPLRVANFQKKNPGEADVNNDGTLSPDELRVGLGRFGVKDDAVEVVQVIQVGPGHAPWRLQALRARSAFDPCDRHRCWGAGLEGPRSSELCLALVSRPSPLKRASL